MRFRLIALGVLLSGAACAEGTPPLDPKQLEAGAELIVTGQVESHGVKDHKEGNSIVLRHVFLKVRIETVLKGNAKPGDVVRCRCVAVLKEPRDEPLEHVGHDPIPGDGGKAKFYLRSRGPENVWIVLDPNGAELLDQTPPLRYEREKGDPLPKPRKPPVWSDWRFWVTVVGIFVAVVLWSHFRRRRPPAPSV